MSIILIGLLSLTFLTFLNALSTAEHHHHHHSHHLHVVHHHNHPMRFARAKEPLLRSLYDSAFKGRKEKKTVEETTDEPEKTHGSTAKETTDESKKKKSSTTTKCFSKSEGAPGCCPDGSVDTGETEDCEDPVSHGASYLGRHCKASIFTSSKKKDGWRAKCTTDTATIKRINKEKEEREQAEQTMLAASRKQLLAQEIATAENILEEPASLALCKFFHSQANLCEAAGCEFVSKTKPLFGSNDVRNVCNFGCCPTKQPRTGQSPTTAVCNALKTKSSLCAEAGCLYHASSKMFQSSGTCKVPGHDEPSATAEDVSSPDRGIFVGEDETLVSPDMDENRQLRLRSEYEKADQAFPDSQKVRNEGYGEIKDDLRTQIVSGLKRMHHWIKRHQHGCRTGFFAMMKGQVQPTSCMSCTKSSVGGLFTSSNLCSWCALDGHSSNIGFCVSDASVCVEMKTTQLKKEFGEHVRFSTAITEINQWQCPNQIQSQLRQCQRGCDLRCEGTLEKDWAQQQQQNTGNVCIDPSKCETACAKAMPRELEEILFEERLARTSYAKAVSMELCIRGCTDRKVGFQDIDSKISAWEFEEIDLSKSECNDMCELTVTGTIQRKQAVELNDATVAKEAGSGSLPAQVTSEDETGSLNDATVTKEAGSGPLPAQVASEDEKE